MSRVGGKRAAALAALGLNVLEEAEIVGVGTGSTVREFIRVIAKRDEFRGKIFVPSSVDTALELRRLGLTVVPLELVDCVDVYVDGADEVVPSGDMIKGRGGALTREKLLAFSSRVNIFVVDESKVVRVLGSKPVPVEVLMCAQSAVINAFKAMGLRPKLRMAEAKDGPVVTDNYGVIIDLHVRPISDPPAFERMVKTVPGVVEVGIFTGLADYLVVGYEGGSSEVIRVERRRRAPGC